MGILLDMEGEKELDQISQLCGLTISGSCHT